MTDDQRPWLRKFNISSLASFKLKEKPEFQLNLVILNKSRVIFLIQYQTEVKSYDYCYSKVGLTSFFYWLLLESRGILETPIEIIPSLLSSLSVVLLVQCFNDFSVSNQTQTKIGFM